MKNLKIYKCICCGFEIEPVDLEWTNEINPEDNMWVGGTVEKIRMPYGSRLDGNEYNIAICDNCIKEKEQLGTVRNLNT